MKYMGSKNRIAKHLLPIMLENRNGRTWVEPFVGGANMIDKVDGKRIGADFNEYVISLFTGIQNGFIPPNEVSEQEYKQARLNREVTPLVSFIGSRGILDGIPTIAVSYCLQQMDTNPLQTICYGSKNICWGLTLPGHTKQVSRRRLYLFVCSDLLLLLLLLLCLLYLLLC